MGDGNPCYLDEELAAKSRHGGIVAPPATLDIWDRPGLPAQPRFRPPAKPAAEDPRSKALRMLEEAGVVGGGAVNSEPEGARHPPPRGPLQKTPSLHQASEEKQDPP